MKIPNENRISIYNTSNGGNPKMNVAEVTENHKYSWETSTTMDIVDGRTAINPSETLTDQDVDSERKEEESEHSIDSSVQSQTEHSKERSYNKVFQSIEDEIAHIVGEAAPDGNNSYEEKEESRNNINNVQYENFVEHEHITNLNENENERDQLGALKENLEGNTEVCVKGRNQSDEGVEYENIVEQEEIEDYDMLNEERLSPSGIEEDAHDEDQQENHRAIRKSAGAELNKEFFLNNVNLERQDNIENRFPESSDNENGNQYDTNNLMNVSAVRILHKCPLCQYTTLHSSVLTKHISSVHNSKAKRKCPHCCKKFPTRLLLKEHILDEHTKKLRKCSYCPHILLGNGKDMRHHVTQNHRSMKVETVEDGLKRNGSKGLYSCEKCYFTSKSLGVIQSHVKMHCLQYVLQCIHCYYITNDRKFYKIHLANSHKLAKKVYICKRCFFNSEDQDEYNEHIHQPHKPHVCAVCDFITPRIENLYSHIEEEHKSDKLNDVLCSQCGYKATSANNLKSHIKAIHTKELMDTDLVVERQCSEEDGGRSESERTFIEMEFRCTPAEHSEGLGNNIEFEEVDGISEQRYVVRPDGEPSKTESKDQSFKCSQCDFSTEIFTVFIDHEQRTHRRIFFKCPSCVFETNDKSVLITHHMGHDTDRSIQTISCPFCEFEAEDHIGLKSHVNFVHLDILQNGLEEELVTGDENGTVEDQDGNANQRLDTAYFIRDDGLERTYHCKLCSYKVPDMHSLKSHIKTEHIVEKLKCPRCSLVQSLTLREFWNHLNQHCPQCRFQSDDPNRLKSHMLTHVPRYKSSNCVQSSNSNNSSDIFSLIPKRKALNEFQSHSLEEENRNSFKIDSDSIKKGLWNDNYKMDKENSSGETDIDMIADYEDLGDSFNGTVGYSTAEEIRVVFVDSSSEEEDFFEIPEDSNVSVERDFETDYFKESNRSMNKETKIIDNSNSKLLNPFSIPIKNGNIQQIEKRRQGEIRLIIDESAGGELSRESSESEEADPYVKPVEPSLGKPVKIIKLLKDQCFDCLNVYKNRNTLIDHRKRLHGLKKPHSCTYCMENFETYNYLKSHYYRFHKVTYHNAGNIFKCPLCNYSSVYLRQTRKHVMREHQRDAVGFKKYSKFV